jgi:hypothetical protein
MMMMMMTTANTWISELQVRDYIPIQKPATQGLDPAASDDDVS